MKLILMCSANGLIVITAFIIRYSLPMEFDEIAKFLFTFGLSSSLTMMIFHSEIDKAKKGK